MKIAKKVSRRDAETQRETTTEVVVAKPVEPEVMPPLGKIEEPDYTKPAECINFHLGMAQHHGRVAIAHLIVAGQELAKQKQVLGYGGWNEFCEKELSINRITADRYVKFFYKVIVERRVAGIPFDKLVTNKELAEATVGMEGKSATRAMIDLGIIKRNPNHGGDRREQAAANGHRVGRKPDDAPTAEVEVVSLDEIKDTPAVLWGLCRDPLHKLNDLQRERHFIDRLEFVELSEVYNILKGLFEAAETAMKRMQKEGRHA
ncbi:MAG: hypothetical protein IKJ89_08325 [Kiritimatiellae bacterium]|nr:hypothetical protein [Kiritimatiellia bacterium]